MPKKDVIHDAVKNALLKDGWIITDDPFTIEYEEIKVFADLAAERAFGLLALERGNCRIVVEIKSFIGRSPIHDLEIALGQYSLYLGLLEKYAPDRKLYLAVSDDVFEEVFKQKAVEMIVERFQMALLVVGVNKEEVLQWIH